MTLELPTTVRYPVAVVGDVHGHIEMLDGLLDRLDREAPDHAIVFLGDFVDRGPHPARVVERVIGLVRAGRAAAVTGNHDHALVRAAGLDGRPVDPWWRDRYRDLYHCEPTVASYLGRRPARRTVNADLAALAEAVPAAHRTFLAGLPWLVTTPPSSPDGPDGGGHLFLHCGLSRALTLPPAAQVAAMARKEWSVDTVRAGTTYAATARANYPPWVGGDRGAAIDPLPLAGWTQVTGHEVVEQPTWTAGGMRIDTSGGVYEPLTAYLVSGPASGGRFVQFPDRGTPVIWGN